MSNDTKRIPAGTYAARALVFKEADNESPAVEDLGDKAKMSVAIDLFELGEQCRTYLYFSDEVKPGKTMSASQVSYPRLEAMGWTGQDITDPTGLGSTEFKVSVKYEMYNGKETMKVDVLTGSGGKAVSTGDLRSIASRFKNPNAPARPAARPAAVAARKF